MTELALQSAAQLLVALRNKTESSADLLEHFIERAQRLNSNVNAIVTFDVDKARQRARQLDQLSAQTQQTGVLHGLPITIKDTLETAG